MSVFDAVLILRCVIWIPLGEGGIFDLGNVALEAWFLHGVVVLVLVSILDTASTGTFLLLQLGFVSHGGVLDIDNFVAIMLR